MSLITLILQIGVILIAARLFGIAFRKIRQPQVMGEMIAGIALGPSVLGALAPVASATLFPLESLGILNALSQVGLLIFMFLVGLQLDTKSLRDHSQAAVLISHASIAVPFASGTALAFYLYPRFSDDQVGFLGFALFMGAAMSITAFPVLARILTERNLVRTPLGTVVIACAAADDVTAWCILAGIVALVRTGEGSMPLWGTIAGLALYAGFVLFVLRRVLYRAFSRKTVTDNQLAVILALVFGSALMTEWLGVHFLFGAFVMGVMMPKKYQFVQALLQKFESVTIILLLPLFFAYTGLRTSIRLIDGMEMWLYCTVIILVAVAGKLGGSVVAARIGEMPWRESFSLGILMNTRGLMELVILNIGLDIGVISPALFSMMVIMALVTTFMTSPLLEWIYPANLVQNRLADRAA